MQEAISGLWRRPWLTFAGAVLGILLAPTLNYSVGALTDAYYRIAPVSRLSAVVLRADANEIVVRLRAERNYAPGCQYLLLRARTIDAQGEYELARIERIDQPATGEPLPTGKHDAGVWRIVPRSDGVRVTITPMYDCGGRIVWGIGADLALPSLAATKDRQT